VDGTRRYAVLDGRTVAEGDSVDGGWVIKITAQSLLLWKHGTFAHIQWSEAP
jgi:hypothetical protein